MIKERVAAAKAGKDNTSEASSVSGVKRRVVVNDDEDMEDIPQVAELYGLNMHMDELDVEGEPNPAKSAKRNAVDSAGAGAGASSRKRESASSASRGSGGPATDFTIKKLSAVFYTLNRLLLDESKGSGSAIEAAKQLQKDFVEGTQELALTETILSQMANAMEAMAQLSDENAIIEEGRREVYERDDIEIAQRLKTLLALQPKEQSASEDKQ